MGSRFHHPGASKVWGNLQVSDKIKPLPGTIPTLSLAKENLNEDERRLFYVALTRAKQEVAISFCERDVSGTRLRGTSTDAVYSRNRSGTIGLLSALPPEQVLAEISTNSVKNNISIRL